MFDLFSKRERRLPPHIWTHPPVHPPIDTAAVVRALAERWDGYSASALDLDVTQHDDMLGEAGDATAEYRAVGLSALQILSEAMILSGRTRFGRILDLPCGGGRITRHLKLFFPDGDLFVADIDKDKERAVADQFGARTFAFPADYRGAPDQRFDLIFCGSLLTHFDRALFERALAYFIAALEPGGLAVLTLHGRNSAAHALAPKAFEAFTAVRDAFAEHRRTVKFRTKTNFDPDVALNRDFRRTGFGYFANPTWSALYGQSYGGSYTMPSWTLNRIEARSDCRIVGYKEVAYGNNQDVVIVQKV